MRSIWRQRTCRQCPIMRFDRCFVPSFLYFEFYAISSIKLFRHQLYLYARQNGPTRVCPASRRCLHTFYTPICNLFFLKNSHSTNITHYGEINMFIRTRTLETRTITLNNSIYYIYNILSQYICIVFVLYSLYIFSM